MAAAWPPLAGWRRGDQVTVTDLSTADSLAGSIAQLADVPIAHWTLGRHDEADFAAADAIIANPAVRPTSRCWQRLPARRADHFGNRAFSARLRGLGHCGHRLQRQVDDGLDAVRHFRPGWRPSLAGGQHRRQPAWRLPEIHPGDRVVLEVSSFQLAHLRPQRSGRRWEP